MYWRKVASGTLERTWTPVVDGWATSSARQAMGVRFARAASRVTNVCLVPVCMRRTCSYSARCWATNAARPSSLREAGAVTGTARLASSTWTTGSL